MGNVLTKIQRGAIIPGELQDIVWNPIWEHRSLKYCPIFAEVAVSLYRSHLSHISQFSLHTVTMFTRTTQVSKKNILRLLSLGTVQHSPFLTPHSHNVLFTWTTQVCMRNMSLVLILSLEQSNTSLSPKSFQFNCERKPTTNYPFAERWKWGNKYTRVQGGVCHTKFPCRRALMWNRQRHVLLDKTVFVYPWQRHVRTYSHNVSSALCYTRSIIGFIYAVGFSFLSPLVVPVFRCCDLHCRRQCPRKHFGMLSKH